MELLNGIYSRRSVRKFTTAPVSDEMMTSLLKAAMQAPSAGNQRPWHFVVIKTAEVLNETIPARLPYAMATKSAPCAILVAADMRELKHASFWPQDCAACTQNILLAAHALGLGAVWCGVCPEEDRMAAMREICALPEYIQPFAIIAVGHPDQALTTADRFDANRIHSERF